MRARTKRDKHLLQALGIAIFERRAHLSLSQTRVAAEAGVLQSVLSRMEAGKILVSPSTLEQVALALDTSPVALWAKAYSV